VTVTVNGQSDTYSSVVVSSNSAQIDSVTPSTYSPVLKTDLEIVISSGFSGSFTKDDFTVMLVPQDSSMSSRELNVYKADSGTNTLTVRYGGAYSGTYDVVVHSASFGSIDSNGATFIAAGVVTGLSPTSGSLNGGTLLTITGYTFSDSISDNIVKVGNAYCDMIESSETEIKCRTPKRALQEAGTDSVIVFLKTSEEAVWTTSSAFEWVETGQEVTAFTSEYDSATKSVKMTFTGNNLGGTVADVEVYVDGHAQTVDSVSATEIVAYLTNADDLSSTDIQIYLPEGAPTLSATLAHYHTPYFFEVFPAVGSPAGSILYIGAAGDDLCKEISVESYATIRCVTKALDLASGTTLSIKHSGTTYSCVGTCSY